MWKEIQTQSDIDELMSLYGAFHDSCLHDIYICTGDYVYEDLSMNFTGKLIFSLLFQRQAKSFPVLELKIKEVENYKLHLFDRSTMIYESKIILLEELIYWADDVFWEIGDEDDTNWVCGKKMLWRLRPELLGNVQRLPL